MQEKLKTQMPLTRIALRISLAGLLAAMMVSICSAGEAPMVSTSNAGEAPKCADTKIPVQITEVAKSAPWPNMSFDSEQDFRRFVTKITEHLSAWQAKEQLCLGNADSKKPSWLKFEKWPDFTAGSKPLVPPPSFDERPSHGCRITSPWIDIAVERKPTVWVRAVVRWNPRQTYVDQAILSGARNVPPGVAMPLMYDEFSRFAEDYGVPGGDFAYLDTRAHSLAERLKLEDERLARQKLIEARMPSDLAWLFRHISTHERDPYADKVRRRMHTSMVKYSDDYTKLIMALIQRCVASEGVEKNYQSILDAADLISLEKYKMIMATPD